MPLSPSNHRGGHRGWPWDHQKHLQNRGSELQTQRHPSSQPYQHPGFVWFFLLVVVAMGHQAREAEGAGVTRGLKESASWQDPRSSCSPVCLAFQSLPFPPGPFCRCQSSQWDPLLLSVARLGFCGYSKEP